MNFALLGQVDVTGLDLTQIPESMWQQSTWRQSYSGTAHGDTSTIYLNMCRKVDPVSVLNDFEAVPQEEVLDHLHQAVPQLLQTLLHLMQVLRPSQTGRLMLVRLQAGGRVAEHRDQGAYARYYRRAHLPVATNEACTMTVNGEVKHLPAGQVWTFDHWAPHSVTNGGVADRIHLIMDYV